MNKWMFKMRPQIIVVKIKSKIICIVFFYQENLQKKRNKIAYSKELKTVFVWFKKLDTK